jgi:hypothetical protein
MSQSLTFVTNSRASTWNVFTEILKIPLNISMDNLWGICNSKAYPLNFKRWEMTPDSFCFSTDTFDVEVHVVESTYIEIYVSVKDLKEVYGAYEKMLSSACMPVLTTISM